MCCSNMQRHAWTIVSTPIYNCFATGHNKLTSSFKYFKIIFLHVFTTCYNTSYNKAISLLHIIILQQCVAVQWHLAGNVRAESASHQLTSGGKPIIMDLHSRDLKDNRHPASNNPAILSVILFDQTSSLLLLPHQHFNLHHFCIVLSWSRCSCQEGSHLNH